MRTIFIAVPVAVLLLASARLPDGGNSSSSTLPDGGTTASSSVDAGTPHVVLAGPDGGVAFDVSCNVPSDCSLTQLEPSLQCPTTCALPGLVVNKRELDRVKSLFAELKRRGCPRVFNCPKPSGGSKPTCRQHVCGSVGTRAP